MCDSLLVPNRFAPGQQVSVTVRVALRIVGALAVDVVRHVVVVVVSGAALDDVPDAIDEACAEVPLVVLVEWCWWCTWRCSLSLRRQGESWHPSTIEGMPAGIAASAAAKYLQHVEVYYGTVGGQNIDLSRSRQSKYRRAS